MKKWHMFVKCISHFCNHINIQTFGNTRTQRKEEERKKLGLELAAVYSDLIVALATCRTCKWWLTVSKAPISRFHQNQGFHRQCLEGLVLSFLVLCINHRVWRYLHLILAQRPRSGVGRSSGKLQKTTSMQRTSQCEIQFIHNCCHGEVARSENNIVCEM